jgi:nucleoside-diphosphate-sugar epimerase
VETADPRSVELDEIAVVELLEEEVAGVVVDAGGGMLVDMIEDIAGVRLQRRYELNAPKGVAGRNSDNTFIQQVLGWEPSTPLQIGLEKTYTWIQEQYESRKAGTFVPAGHL